MIATGKLQPNDRIVESEIGAILGMSRVPVREATRILAGEGVLELTPERGARVREVTVESAIDALKLLIGFSSMGLDDAVQHPSFDTNAQQLSLLSEAIVAHAKPSADQPIFPDVGLYHQSLIVFSGNRLLSMSSEKIRFSHYYTMIGKLIDQDTMRQCAQLYPDMTESFLHHDTGHIRGVMATILKSMLTAITAGRQVGDLNSRPEKSKKGSG